MARRWDAKTGSYFCAGPYAAALGERIPIVLVGEPGTDFLVGLRKLSDDSPAARWDGTIQDDFREIVWVEPGIGFGAGHYRYEAAIRTDPQSPWKMIRSESTPSRWVEGVLTVYPEEPDVNGAGAQTWASSPWVERPWINWGLSEY